MKPIILLCVGVLLASPLARAAQNFANVSIDDVEQQLTALDAAIQKEASVLPAQKVQGLLAQESTLAARVEKVKTGGPVTAAEHDALLAAIQAQEKQLQAALPKPRPVDTAALPGSAGTSYVPGSYGLTTTITPTGNAVMNSGPVVNGVPQGETVVQPTMAQPGVK